MKNGIEDLRDHLFATIESLRDEEKPMDVDRAQAIANVADKLIQSAKVEVDYIKATDARSGTGFLDIRPKLKAIEGKR